MISKIYNVSRVKIEIIFLKFNFGISEQFPEEIEKVRQKLYPEMRRAKAEKQRVRLVRDKLFINNVEFIPDNS